MRPTRLADEEVASRLRALRDWTVKDGKLHRDFRFADFTRAFAFMTAVALRAEAMGHHPEWFNVYDRVSVDLTTHDAGGITELDFQLAAFADSVAEQR
jgi:4a-hydroxytetrahydrobiopterin dehydratase